MTNFFYILWRQVEFSFRHLQDLFDLYIFRQIRWKAHFALVDDFYQFEAVEFPSLDE